MSSIYDPIPNNPFYYPPTYSLDTPQGGVILGSGLSITPQGVIVSSSLAGGTVTDVTAGIGLLGGTIYTSGTIDLAAATTFSLGGIKVGANLFIAGDGTLSALPQNPGTINNITVGAGLSGGGTGPAVSINLNAASTTQVGGVIVGNGIDVVGGLISLTAATTTQRGGVFLATPSEVVSGVDTTKAVTPAGIAAKVASTSARGIVQLSDSVATSDSTVAATQTAAKIAYDAAVAAQVTASAALPKSGGTMTGPIVFAPGQSYAGIIFPVATTLSTGVISVGPGLSVNSSGVLSTLNNGTVTAVTCGPGLGNPATGGTISNSGTIRLLPPNGASLGGVKAGDNISIAFDGTISVPGGNFIASNNQNAYNSYIWPAPNAPGPGPILVPPCPGANGQVLTITNQTTGRLGWTSTGTLASVLAGPGISVSSTPTQATVSLTTVPSVVPGNYGGQALIPFFNVNAYGQVSSVGVANPYSQFQTATVSAPPILVLDFAFNNLTWQWVLQGNLTIQDPLNAQSGQTGYLLIQQNGVTPFSLNWGSAWKFPNGLAYAGNNTLSAVDLIEFVVVSANNIIVKNIVPSVS